MKKKEDEPLGVEIELIPIEKEFGSFINIAKKEEEIYYHIYFNDSNEEIKRYCLTEKDNVTKIRIIILNGINIGYNDGSISSILSFPYSLFAST